MSTYGRYKALSAEEQEVARRAYQQVAVARRKGESVPDELLEQALLYAPLLPKKSRAAPALRMGDLFAMTGAWGEAEGDIDAQASYILPTEVHLARDEHTSDGVTAACDLTSILTCKRCGSLVPDDNTTVHLDWHRRIEGARQ